MVKVPNACSAISFVLIRVRPSGNLSAALATENLYNVSQKWKAESYARSCIDSEQSSTFTSKGVRVLCSAKEASSICRFISSARFKGCMSLSIVVSTSNLGKLNSG